MMPATVLLVHGAMHTPWIFGPLRERLSGRGISSQAVQLPSSSPDSSAAQGLHEDVVALRAAAQTLSGPVVLAAHSYGGVPATWAAADLPEVAELVYIAAFVLAPGTSMLDWMGGEFPPDWIHSDDGLAVKAGDPEQSIFSGVGAALTAEAVSRLNWQGLRAFTEPLRSTPTETPATYIVATEDRALPPEVQNAWAARAQHRTHIPAGHSPHLSHPDAVASTIADTVQRSRAAAPS